MNHENGKKNTCFVLAASENIGFAAGNVAIGLHKYLQIEDYDCVILHNNLKRSDLDAVASIPHCAARKFKFPTGFEHEMIKRMPSASRFGSKNGIMSFAHFELFRLLEEYHTVIWLDTDMMVQDDICELLNFSPFGIGFDDGFPVQNNFTDPIPGYCMNALGYRSCIIVAYDSLPYMDIFDWCYQKALQYAPFLLNGDQGIINLAVQEFHLSPRILSINEWHCLPRLKAAKTARIVHAGHKEKFWNSPDMEFLMPEWFENHRIWLQKGGTDGVRMDTPFTVNRVGKLMRRKTTRPLFPFRQIKQGENIVILGAGQTGRDYLDQIEALQYCRVLFFIDDNFRELPSSESRVPVYPLEKIIAAEYDRIVIAVDEFSSRAAIIQRLLNIGVPESRIIGWEDNRRELLDNWLVSGFHDIRSLFTRNGPMMALPVAVAHHPDSFERKIEYRETEILFNAFIHNNEYNNNGDLPRFYSLILNLLQCEKEAIQGDFAEVGVHKGNTAALLWRYAKKSGRSLFLFDTFSGFPQDRLQDDEYAKSHKFADTCFHDVKTFLGEDPCLHYVVGVFPESAVGDCVDRKYAFVHLDCDLYDSIRAGLEFFLPRVSAGGFFLVHDYSSGRWKGCTKAVDELCADHGLRPILLPDKSGSAVFRVL